MPDSMMVVIMLLLKHQLQLMLDGTKSRSDDWLGFPVTVCSPLHETLPSLTSCYMPLTAWGQLLMQGGGHFEYWNLPVPRLQLHHWWNVQQQQESCLLTSKMFTLMENQWNTMKYHFNKIHGKIKTKAPTQCWWKEPTKVDRFTVQSLQPTVG